MMTNGFLFFPRQRPSVSSSFAINNRRSDQLDTTTKYGSNSPPSTHINSHPTHIQQLAKLLSIHTHPATPKQPHTPSSYQASIPTPPVPAIPFIHLLHPSIHPSTADIHLLQHPIHPSTAVTSTPTSSIPIPSQHAPMYQESIQHRTHLNVSNPPPLPPSPNPKSAISITQLPPPTAQPPYSKQTTDQSNQIKSNLNLNQ